MMRRGLLALLAASVAWQPVAEAATLRAGASAIEITPEKLPIAISGGFLAGRAERVAGRLYARCLALDDGRERLAICVADSLMMPRELLDRVKSQALARTGLAPDHILISANHTHSAPPVMGALGTDADPDYARFVESRLSAAIEKAVGALEPARIGWVVVEDREHTHCRRWILRPDRMRKDPFGRLTVRAHMHPGYQNPDFVGPAGPVDPDLSILAVQTAAGRPLALLANYSMHYVGAGGGVVSPDYYGPFAEQMERLIGPGVVAMMSQGTSGDQHWMDYSRPKQAMNPQTYARELAPIAFGAYQKIEYRDWAPVRMAEATLRLDRRIPNRERLGWARKILAGMGDRLPRNQEEVYAREQVLLDREPVRELKLQALRIGELGIAAIPCEVFAITGLKIKARSPLRPTFNIELANGAEGYIPPPEQHHLGGYTTWPARTAALETGAEPKIVDTVMSLLEQVAGKPGRREVEPANPYYRRVVASRPLAYWRGDEMSGPVARDASGRGNHGAYAPGIAYFLEGAPSGGGGNRAPQYAGGHLSATLGSLRDRYSLELWLLAALPGGDLFERGGEKLSMDAEGRLVLGGPDGRIAGATVISPKSWTYVALVRDGPQVRVYLNGRPELSSEVEQAPNSQEVRIGGGFEGRIDEVAVFERALTSSEIVKRYAAATGK